MTLLFFAVIITMNINHDSTIIVASENEETENVVAENESEVPEKVNENDTGEIKENNEENPDVKENNTPVSKKITFTILGEMMMGGEVTTSTNYLYNSAFKKVYTYTRSSDFTYATFSTNITTLDEIKNARSKYLVTKGIQNTFVSLGIDAVNIASDHMTDYSSTIFNSTLSVIKEANVYIAGLNDSILYLEKNDKKIAIVAANNVFIGNKYNYTDYGINVYNQTKMKNDIITAKQNADFVIVDMHWGREYIYGVTYEMKSIAYSAIDSGADLVMGTHAYGIYPIITYNDVPIIYSTGYIMTDSESELTKQSYIFDILINEENKIESLEMIPIYIKDKKEVMLYNEYNKDFAFEFNTQMNNWNKQNALNSEIKNGNIVINF